MVMDAQAFVESSKDTFVMALQQQLPRVGSPVVNLVVEMELRPKVIMENSAMTEMI